MNELISIVMPVYNSEQFINDTIRSVLAQTYEDWELILIDDASTDGSEAVICEYIKYDKRIRYIRLEKNSGAAYARNIGISKARGNYIAFLDSDDLWRPEKLELQYHYMKERNVAFSCTYYQQMDESGKKFGKIMKAPPKADYRRVLFDNPIGTLTAMYSVERLGKIYGPLIRKRNDYALWLKLLKQTDYVYCLDEILAYYRIRQNSLSRNKFHLIQYQWELYRKCEGLSVISSAFHVGLIILIKILGIKPER